MSRRKKLQFSPPPTSKRSDQQQEQSGCEVFRACRCAASMPSSPMSANHWRSLLCTLAISSAMRFRCSISRFADLAHCCSHSCDHVCATTCRSTKDAASSIWKSPPQKSGPRLPRSITLDRASDWVTVEFNHRPEQTPDHNRPAERAGYRCLNECWACGEYHPDSEFTASDY
jgi:hypothetical protein